MAIWLIVLLLGPTTATATAASTTTLTSATAADAAVQCTLDDSVGSAMESCLQSSPTSSCCNVLLGAVDISARSVPVALLG